MAKVPNTAANADLYKKYGVTPNTVVFCAPNGDKLLVLSGTQCSQSAMLTALKSVKDAMASWKQKKT